MKKRLISVLLAVSALAAQGCATTTKLQANEVTDVRRVVVLAPTEPPEYKVKNDGSLAGLVIGNLMTEQLDDRLTAAINNKNSKVSTYLSSELVRHLTARGYEVELIQSRPRPQLLTDYTAYATADAVFDLSVLLAGYANVSTFNRKQRPALWLKTRLARPTGAVLYADEVSYGYDNPFIIGTKLSAPKDHYYASFDAMFADEDALVSHFVVGMDAVAAHLANLLPERKN